MRSVAAVLDHGGAAQVRRDRHHHGFIWFGSLDTQSKLVKILLAEALIVEHFSC